MPWPGHPGMPMGYGAPRGMMPRGVYPPRIPMPPQMRPRMPQQGVVVNAPGQTRMMVSPTSSSLPMPGRVQRPSSMLPQQKNIPGSSGQPQLTSAALANMSPEDQKNALGERLYASILQVHPEKAA